jgi:hypothetical protein
MHLRAKAGFDSQVESLFFIFIFIFIFIFFSVTTLISLIDFFEVSKHLGKGLFELHRSKDGTYARHWEAMTGHPVAPARAKPLRSLGNHSSYTIDWAVW